MATQQSPSQPGTSAAMSAPKHGATTITDPVQMMWQQQQIQSPSPHNPHKGGPQLWPPSEPVAPAQKAVASPSQRRQQQHTQSHGTRQQHSHQPATQPPAGFQPFQHGLLPQLRTSAAPPPSSPVSSTTLSMPSQAAAAVPHSGSLQFPPGVPASLGFNSSGSQPADGMPAPSPSLQHITAAAGLVPHFSAPFSLASTPQSPSSSAWGSARGSFDGYPQPTEEPGSEALSTFHLPEGLAEQLSTSHSHPLPSSHTLQPNQPPSPATDAQPHQQQQQQQAQAQAQALAPQLGAKQPKPKLTSPPGFARRLDGAAKPFIPGRPMSAGSESSQQPVQGPAASTPWTPTARGHLRPPPGMGMPAGGSGPGRLPAYSHAPSSPGYLAGQQQPIIPGGAKPQQPANLASGQWALANNSDGTGAVLGTPFSHLSSGDRPFGAEAHSSVSSSSQWQVPDMQLAQTGHRFDNHAAACVLDSDQHETSGLAPNDVLDFLGIGSDEQQSSDASQFERHRSQGPSSNGDTAHSSWLNN